MNSSARCITSGFFPSNLPTGPLIHTPKIYSDLVSNSWSYLCLNFKLGEFPKCNFLRDCFCNVLGSLPKFFWHDSPLPNWLPAASCSGKILPGFFPFGSCCILKRSDLSPHCMMQRIVRSDLPLHHAEGSQIMPLHHAAERKIQPLQNAAGSQNFLQIIMNEGIILS